MTSYSHTCTIIERLQTRITTLKLLRKEELYKADHNKSDEDKLDGEILSMHCVKCWHVY